MRRSPAAFDKKKHGTDAENDLVLAAAVEIPCGGMCVLHEALSSTGCGEAKDER